MAIEKKSYTKSSEPAEIKQPYQIPDPPPPSKEPETPREPNIITSDPASLEATMDRVEKAIDLAISELRSVNSNESVLAIGKLRGALQKLGLESN